jgi:AraC family transcriptional regulator of adaptative response/methylated-DNA-[protein]-cysteine methyltransferase
MITRATDQVSRARQLDWPRILQSACRIIETEAPALAELARRVGVSRAELQRQFTRRLGVSPKSYGQTLNLHRLAKGAGLGRNVIDAVFAAGFGTNSAAYAAASETLGVTPGRLRAALDIGWWMGLSDLGWMLLGATDAGICWLTFGTQPGALLEEMSTCPSISKVRLSSRASGARCAAFLWAKPQPTVRWRGAWESQMRSVPSPRHARAITWHS